MTKVTYQPITIEATTNVDSRTQEVCEGMRHLYHSVGYQFPWIGYLAFGAAGEVVGTCAFKSPPKDGRVEIAYFTFPEFEGRGIATQMAKYLISLATENEVMVFAQTLPEENASTSILKKLGFTLLGTVRHPEDGDVWEWNLS